MNTYQELNQNLQTFDLQLSTPIDCFDSPTLTLFSIRGMGKSPRAKLYEEET